MNGFSFNVNTIRIPNVCTAPWNLQHIKDLKMTEWSVETCSPIISSNKCCADVNNWLIYVCALVGVLIKYLKGNPTACNSEQYEIAYRVNFLVSSYLWYGIYLYCLVLPSFVYICNWIVILLLFTAGTEQITVLWDVTQCG